MSPLVSRHWRDVCRYYCMVALAFASLRVAALRDVESPTNTESTGTWPLGRLGHSFLQKQLRETRADQPAAEVDAVAGLQVQETTRALHNSARLADVVLHPGHLLYIGVLSGPANKARRDHVRASYLKELRRKSRGGEVQAKFIIGHQRFNGASQGTLATADQLAVEKQLEEEAKQHGDIVRIPLPEAYENLPDKVLALLRLAVEDGYSFVVKIDDDQHALLPAMYKVANESKPESLVYAGSYLWNELAYNSQKGADGDFKKYFGGPCYMLSFGIAKSIAIEHGAHSNVFLAYGSSSEDVDMGRWVDFEGKESGSEVQFKTVNLSTSLGVPGHVGG